MANQTSYSIESLRFEVEKGGFTTIWFDLTGARFPRAEAMTNMYVGFDDFLSYLNSTDPTLYRSVFPDSEPARRQNLVVDALDAQGFDWDGQLHCFLDEHFDLESVAEKRLEWLDARVSRQAIAPTSSSKTHAAEADDPTWDDLKHAFLKNLNRAATKTYPALRHASPTTSKRMLEIFDAYSERLSNEIFLLAAEENKRSAAE